ncbi:hypothetical protein [Streptomyces sp. BPTC-684]|uniref:hypothetical protein n=1 Tax=Streptomyces sp. BPTC-684 TaxID=3043734 RepID=UPI0024B0D16D|nr:hypothetical protein [Streptomyces sp. BPTC-684]WHM38202.1 hypothetical protein QIY60_15595 [Streptomyces sp. BPTC-684]
MRFTAVLAGVVLALTGFSGHGHGKSSGGGGGCSNSHKSNGGSGYRHDDDYGSSSGGSGSNSGSYTPSPTPSPSATATGTVVTCVSPAKGKRPAVTSATVRVTGDPLASGSHRYRLEVAFLGAAGETVDTGSAFVTLDAGATETVKVPMALTSRLDKVKECRVVRVMEWS